MAVLDVFTRVARNRTGTSGHEGGPISFLVLRFLCVLLVLLPVCWLARATWPGGADVGRVAVAGVLIQGGYLGGVFCSIHQGMPAGVSALIVGTQPILTAA